MCSCTFSCHALSNNNACVISVSKIWCNLSGQTIACKCTRYITVDWNNVAIAMPLKRLERKGFIWNIMEKFNFIQIKVNKFAISYFKNNEKYLKMRELRLKNKTEPKVNWTVTAYND